MKKITILIVIIGGILAHFAYAKSGCCSWHGGVAGCADSGQSLCRDGTTSASCTCAAKKASSTKVKDNIVNHVCGSDVKVIDGDTLELSGKRFRLACVDTPESKYKGKTQYCLDNETDCGKLAKEALEKIIAKELANGPEICCGWIKKDRYERYLGWCSGKEEINIPFNNSINYKLVIDGYAWFYDGGKECDMFKAPFVEAQKEGRGLFNEDIGGFKEPRLWRKTKTND